jgi:predicted pyridoxine 5'-phosphate oxidase superfamily flavin-nucleotide-binding protein
MTDFYGPSHRALHDAFDTRNIADVLEAVIVHPHLDEDARAFISARRFFFLSTVNEHGHPTVSYKGGAPGFVRVVDDRTLVFPSYDGNGMFLSTGNIAADGRIGLLFMEFDPPHRVRVHAHATVSTDDPMMAEFPGADLVVRAVVTEAFVNCPRYIPRRPRATSKYVPDGDGNAPLPGWKKVDALQPFLPARFQGLAEAESDVITPDEYARRLRDGEA